MADAPRTTPPLPDLSGVDLRRKDAFLAVALSGAAWVTEVEGDIRAVRREGASHSYHPIPRYSATAEGEYAVIEALCGKQEGRRQHECSRFYNSRVATPELRHECRFFGNWPGAARGIGTAATPFLAAAHAAIDLLWPEASAEARNLLLDT